MVISVVFVSEGLLMNSNILCIVREDSLQEDPDTVHQRAAIASSDMCQLWKVELFWDL
ncbi:mCG147889 [Mus musculus]|nr:mCG147889 [Mus musculus]